MINFFHNIRQALLGESRFIRYFIYAIGEIILVVIGILIALSINNWNEGRKEAVRLTAIYRNIQTNLQTDTANIRATIDFQERMDEFIDRQLSGELTDEFLAGIDSVSYKQCRLCRPLNAVYKSFYPEKKGHMLLQGFENDFEANSADLSTQIIQFYSQGIPQIEKNIERIENMASKNLEEYEKMEWYFDLIEGQYNSDMLAYFKDNLNYRNSLVSYKILCTKNYLRDLKEYQEHAIQLLQEIEMELSESEN